MGSRLLRAGLWGSRTGSDDLNGIRREARDRQRQGPGPGSKGQVRAVSGREGQETEKWGQMGAQGAFKGLFPGE